MYGQENSYQESMDVKRQRRHRMIEGNRPDSSEGPKEKSGITEKARGWDSAPIPFGGIPRCLSHYHGLRLLFAGSLPLLQPY